MQVDGEEGDDGEGAIDTMMMWEPALDDLEEGMRTSNHNNNNSNGGGDSNLHNSPFDEETRKKRSKVSSDASAVSLPHAHSRLLDSRIKIALSLYKVQQNIYLLDFQRVEVSGRGVAWIHSILQCFFFGILF